MNELNANPLSEESRKEDTPTQETRGMQPNWDFACKSVRLLFLCTNNSARSQMAEALTHHLSRGQVEAFSAGSHSAEKVHPLAVAAIARLGADMSRYVPKHLDQFRGQAFDRVIILCDQEHETCPTFSGSSKVFNWNTPDPVLLEGPEEQCQRAFNQLAMELTTRIRLLLTLLEKEKHASP